MDGVRLSGVGTGLEVTLDGPGTIALTNSIARFETVQLTTPPGGVCDVTGTDFGKAIPVFVGCTVVGP